MSKGAARYVVAAFALCLIITPSLLPPSATNWLYFQWMWIGLGGAAVLALLFLRPAHTPMLIIGIGYLLHQFEEHGIDATGQRYSLAPFMENLSGLTFSPALIYHANVSFLWPLILAAFLLGRSSGPAQALAGIAFLNGAAHILIGIGSWAYNPGLLTAAIIFIAAPLHYWRQEKDVSPALGLGLAVAAHIAIFASAALQVSSPNP